MNIKLIFLVISMLLRNALAISAIEGHCLVDCKNDTIMFYPVNKNYSGKYDVSGYNCFYTNKALKSGFKKKNRFQKNGKFDWTPTKEIEGHMFKVMGLGSPDILGKNKMKLIVFLKRLEDHADVVLAIPESLDKNDNHLLSTWYHGTKLVIPYLTKSFFDKFAAYKDSIVYLVNNFESDAEYRMLNVAMSSANIRRLRSLNPYTKFKVDDFDYVTTQSFYIGTRFQGRALSLALL